jgi:hypothetical protein
MSSVRSAAVRRRVPGRREQRPGGFPQHPEPANEEHARRDDLLTAGPGPEIPARLGDRGRVKYRRGYGPVVSDPEPAARAGLALRGHRSAPTSRPPSLPDERARTTGAGAHGPAAGTVARGAR